MIYCSMDLMDGKAVQLEQGRPENKKIEVDDIWELARKFASMGPLHVIDLDAALDRGDHRNIIFKLAAQFSIRVGGGIRSIARARAYLDAGVEKIIIGSKAIDQTFMDDLLQDVPRERIIIALDCFRQEIVVNGWQEKTERSAEALFPALEPYCSEFLSTQVDREGLMQGPDVERLQRLRQLTTLPFTAAGGISSVEDIATLSALNIDSVLGMALYTGKIDFAELLAYKKRTEK